MPEFVTYPDLATQFRQTKSWKTFYLNALKSKDLKITKDRPVSEFKWWEAGRPYYNCYPGVTPMLTKLRLDIPMTSIVIPHNSFLVRLREDDRSMVVGKDMYTQTMLFTQVTASTGQRFWSLMITLIGEDGIAASELFLSLYKVTEETLLEDVQRLVVANLRDDLDPVGLTACLKLVCTICLLGTDSELIERDVLADDRRTYETGSEHVRQAIEQRALRRGKNGYAIGRVVESSPHWRNPHPCLVHTGKGGAIPKVIFRKGCVVNKDIATKVPSEYLGS